MASHTESEMASGPPPGDLNDDGAVPREVRETISVLVVDDEHTLRESCASLLRTEGYPVTVVGRGDEAAELIRKKPFDIMLLDLYMSEMTGMQLLEVAREHSRSAIVILMTGNPSVETSIEGLRAGAWDYLTKPFSASHLHIVIGRAAHTVLVDRESRQAREEATEGKGHGQKTRILGVSRALNEAVELARKVAATDASVFISGESGSGKELFAHFIHEHSRRRSRELVPVNCAAIPDSLLESEMFGHVEGAFTGAVREKKGLLEVAHGGTLFLDELTEMPTSTQAKLLRVIQDGVVRRVGSTKTDAVVNVRFIAATNDDPISAVREARLRKDLYYRLRVVPLHIPPLRERPDDIPVLAVHFLSEFWEQHREPGEPAPKLSDGALRSLADWPWRGNIRELRNVMEHLVVLAGAADEIGSRDLPFIEDGVDDEG